MFDHFYCKYLMMNEYQTIITPDGATLKVSTQNFINSLLTLVHDYENYDVRLEGNQNFLTGLAHQIINYNQLYYSIQPQITVNGGKI